MDRGFGGSGASFRKPETRNPKHEFLNPAPCTRYAAHRGKGGEGWGGGGAEEEGKAVGEAHGPVGLVAWRFFRLEPLMGVGNWGLPLLLYQAAVHKLVRGVLGWVELGGIARCHTADGVPLWAGVVVAMLCIGGTYLVGWLMHDKGPIGGPLQALVQSYTPQ